MLEFQHACPVIGYEFLGVTHLSTKSQVQRVPTHHLLNYSSQLNMRLHKVKHALEIKHILELGPVFSSSKAHGLGADRMRRVSEDTQIWGLETEFLTEFSGN